VLLHLLRKLKYVKYVFRNQNEELLGEAGRGDRVQRFDLSKNKIEEFPLLNSFKIKLITALVVRLLKFRFSCKKKPLKSGHCTTEGTLFAFNKYF
jgi:hypothetical protein